MTKQITVNTEIIPAYAVIRLYGHVNTFAEGAIEGEINRLIDMRCPLVVLDFTGVENINSAGITILIGLAERMKDAEARLGAFGLTDHYRKIFKMVGLEEYITVNEDLDSMLEQWQSEDMES